MKDKSRTTVTVSKLKNFSFILFFSASLCRLVLGEILIRLGLYSIMQPILWFLIYAPLILAIFLEGRHKKRVPWLFLVILILVAFYFLMSLLIHPSYLPWYTRETYGIWDTIFRLDNGGIYGFLFFAACTDEKELYKNIKAVGVFTFIFVVYQYLQFKSRGYWQDVNMYGETVQTSYGLTFGYNAAFVAIIFLSVFFYEKKKTALAISIASMILMLLQGSRGSSLVILVFFMFLYIRKLFREGSIKAIASVLAIGILALLIYDNLAGIITFIASVVSDKNLSSRTLNALISNNFFDDSGRGAIKYIVEEQINSGSFWGHGGFGDRPYIGPFYYWGYCHNIILEFQMDFGKYPGLILMILLIAMIVKKFIKVIQDNDEKFYIFVVMLSISFKLLLSGTFWGDKYFWGLLAILLCWRTKKFKRPI